VDLSRHRIAGLDPAHEVWVGWDPPLRTFFGQVYDPERDEDENPFHWVGASPPWLREPGDLAAAMEGFALLGAEMLQTLAADKEANR
jgi:hypothetical protein